MRTRKTSDSKAKSPPKPDKVCNRCKIHAKTSLFKGHTNCPFNACDCVKCGDYKEKIRHKNESAKRLRNMRSQPRPQPSHTTTTSNGSRNSQSTQVSSQRNRRDVDHKTSPKTNGKTSRMRGRPARKVLKRVSHETNGANNDNESPPQLIAQQPLNGAVVEINGNNEPEVEVEAPSMVTAKPFLCAQYLNACQDLSRELAKTQLSSDEIIAAFKFSIIRDCLGNTAMAAEKIACARQEMSLGLSYMLTHPPEAEVVANPRATPSRSAAQLPETNGTNAQMCSTFNVNYRPNNAVNYSPSFTPIRPN